MPFFEEKMEKSRGSQAIFRASVSGSRDRDVGCFVDLPRRDACKLPCHVSSCVEDRDKRFFVVGHCWSRVNLKWSLVIRRFFSPKFLTNVIVVFPLYE